MKIKTPLVLATLLALITVGVTTRATGSFVALWLTPDQQGRWAYDRLEFSAAADLFADPAWQGVAAFAAGRYIDAAASFGRLPTAVGFYNRGNAFLKGREYGKAITAFEQAANEAPDWQLAADNLGLSRYILSYIEGTREQSDTGDETELGADDVVFDNTEERGKTITITNESTIELESADKWMRSVDTETRDFLRMRFALEASNRENL